MILQSISNSCYFDSAIACLLDQYIAAFGGQGTFGLIAGGTLFATFFIVSNGRLTPPAVILLLTGGVVVPLLPGQFGTLAGTIVLLGLAGAVFAAARKYTTPEVR